MEDGGWLEYMAVAAAEETGQNGQDKQGLPCGWASCKLGDILEPSTEKVEPTKIPDIAYVGLEHIEKDTGKLIDKSTSSEVRSTKSRFYSGDLLYGKLRPYLNKVLVPDFEGICSTDILVFPRSSNLDNKYLLYRLLCPDLVRYASRNVSGVQHPRVNFQALSRFEIDLPPLNEQKRIVEKIEELFTELDKGVQYLNDLKTQLRKYRQSVLKHAFSGDLTREWREENKASLEPASVLLERIKKERKAKLGNKYKELPPVDSADLPELPEGWEWVNMEKVTLKIGDIDHSMPKETATGYPYVSPRDFKNDNDIDFVNAKKISKEDFDRLSQKIKPELNDIIFPRYGTIGVNRFVVTNIDFLASYSCAVIKNLKETMDSKYVFYHSISPVVKKEIAKHTRQTTQANVGIQSIKEFIFPLCSLQEQQKIVEEIEKYLSVADKVEQVVEQSLKQADRLRQSILKQAFEGKIVPQDPADEPASTLLERIRAERGKISGKGGK